MNVTTATPAEIDTRLSAIYSEVARLEAKRENALATLDRIAEAQGTYAANYPWNSYEKQEEAAATVRLAAAAIPALRREAGPMEDRYFAEVWTRYYWVTNTGGHIHHTTGCDTCFPTTSFAWMTQYSGMAHDDLVEEAGSTACTVCFPNAPVETLGRRTRMEMPDRKAAREAREAKRAAAAAAEVVVTGMQGWTNEGQGRHVFKTERGATNAIAGLLSSIATWNADHPTMPEWTNDIARIREALAAKGVEYDYDKALAAARKKVTKQGRTPQF